MDTPNTAKDRETRSELAGPIRSLEDAYRRCQQLGMRLSRQRRAILELLWEASEHLSARSIYDRLNQEGKEIGHTSVYQNLEALSRQGIIECIDRCDGRLYGNISDAHSHINCLDTGQIMDVYVELPPELVAKIEAKLGISIAEYRIDFFAYRHARQGNGNGCSEDNASNDCNDLSYESAFEPAVANGRAVLVRAV